MPFVNSSSTTETSRSMTSGTDSLQYEVIDLKCKQAQRLLEARTCSASKQVADSSEWYASPCITRRSLGLKHLWKPYRGMIVAQKDVVSEGGFHCCFAGPGRNMVLTLTRCVWLSLPSQDGLELSPGQCIASLVAKAIERRVMSSAVQSTFCRLSYSPLGIRLRR